MRIRRFLKFIGDDAFAIFNIFDGIKECL